MYDSNSKIAKPKHYQSNIKICNKECKKHPTQPNLQVIDVIEACGLQKDHYLATAVQYILRAGKKTEATNEGQDLAKAVWFLLRKLQKEYPQQYQEVISHYKHLL